MRFTCDHLADILVDVCFIRMSYHDAFRRHEVAEAGLVNPCRFQDMHEGFQGDVHGDNTCKNTFVVDQAVKRHRIGAHQGVAAAFVVIGFRPYSLPQLLWNAVPVLIKIIIFCG